MHLNKDKCPPLNALENQFVGSDASLSKLYAKFSKKSNIQTAIFNLSIRNEFALMLIENDNSNSLMTRTMYSDYKYDLQPNLNDNINNMTADQIHIFYILTPNVSGVSKYSLRYNNVLHHIRHDPNVNYFHGIYWKDWDIVKKSFKSFRFPNSHMPELRGSRNRRGKYARWLSLILVISYAIQFRLPHIVILEDDSKWPTGFFKNN